MNKPMHNRVLNADNLARILSSARQSQNISQKHIAKALGKSIGTIQNWESGLGSPNVLDFLEWFNVLGLNPMLYTLEFLHPDTYVGLDASCSDAEIKEALIDYLKHDAPASEIRKLSFCIFGNTGSSWHSQLDMLVANNHTSLRSRITVASAIVTNYALAKSLGELQCEDHIAPDIDNLKASIEKAMQSVCERKQGYTNIKGDTV